MIQFKSRDKARIKHDKARLRWSHAPFVRLDRPQRDRLRLLAFFFLQLHHGVRFWRRFHSKRRLDLNLFIMDECLFKEWSLVIACGGRGYQRILVVQDKIYLIPLRGSVIFSWPSLPSPSLVVNQQSTFYRPLPLYTPLNTTDPLCLKTTWSRQNCPPPAPPALPPPPPTINMTGPVTIHYLPTWSHLRLEIDFDIVLIFVWKCFYRFYLQ